MLCSCTLHKSDVHQDCRHSYLQSSLAVDECCRCSGSVVSRPPGVHSPSRPLVQQKRCVTRKNRVLQNTQWLRDRMARQARTADAQRRWWESNGDNILCANQIVKGIGRRRSPEVRRRLQGFFKPSSPAFHVVRACREDNKRLIKDRTQQPPGGRRRHCKS